MRSECRPLNFCLLSGVLAATCVNASADAPRPDSGKFTLSIQGKTIGTDTFRLLPDGCDSDVQLSAGAGPQVQFHQTLTFKKGQWTQVKTEAGALGTMALTLAADKSTVKVNDKPVVVQKLPAVAYPFGNSSPHLFAYVIGAYDTKKGGEQKFELVFSEGVGPKGVLVMSAVLKAPQTSARQIGGKPVSVSRYPIALNTGSTTLAMEVLTDKDKHVLFWTVPVQKYSAVRDGFQDLAK